MSKKTKKGTKVDVKTKDADAPATDAAQASTTKDNGSTEVAKPAAATPWRSWGALEDWFDDWFEGWPPALGRRIPELRARMSDVEAIRVEQYADGDDLVVRAEIAGVDPDEGIEVSVAGGKLTISAHRKQRDETKDNGSFRSEFHYGSFTRTMSVPATTSAEDVTATYTDGVLEVRVPVNDAEEAKTKVAITHG